MSVPQQRVAAQQQNSAQMGVAKEFEWSPYARQMAMANKQRQRQIRTNAVRTNASLPENTWTSVDDAVYDTRDATLKIVNHLRAQGLVENISVDTKFDTWNQKDGHGTATIGMDPETEDAESSVSFGMEGVPVPMVWDEFSVGFRETVNPQGQNPVNASISTLEASNSSRLVNETIENLIWNGWGQTIYDQSNPYNLWGFTNHPKVNTGTFSADWAADSSVIRSDVRQMRRVIKKENGFKPGNVGYWTYFSEDYFDELDDVDAKGSGDMLVRDRVENLSNINRIEETEFLPPKSAVMFRPTRDVIDLGVGMDLTPLQWEGPLRDSWMNLACIYPRIKTTKQGECGAAFFTAP